MIRTFCCRFNLCLRIHVAYSVAHSNVTTPGFGLANFGAPFVVGGRDRRRLAHFAERGSFRRWPRLGHLEKAFARWEPPPFHQSPSESALPCPRISAAIFHFFVTCICSAFGTARRRGYTTAAPSVLVASDAVCTVHGMHLWELESVPRRHRTCRLHFRVAFLYGSLYLF